MMQVQALYHIWLDNHTCSCKHILGTFCVFILYELLIFSQSGCVLSFSMPIYHMDKNSVDPDQLASDEAS